MPRRRAGANPWDGLPGRNDPVESSRPFIEGTPLQTGIDLAARCRASSRRSPYGRVRTRVCTAAERGARPWADTWCECTTRRGVTINASQEGSCKEGRGRQARSQEGSCEEGSREESRGRQARSQEEVTSSTLQGGGSAACRGSSALVISMGTTSWARVPAIRLTTPAPSVRRAL